MNNIYKSLSFLFAVNSALGCTISPLTSKKHCHFTCFWDASLLALTLLLFTASVATTSYALGSTSTAAMYIGHGLFGLLARCVLFAGRGKISLAFRDVFALLATFDTEATFIRSKPWIAAKTIWFLVMLCLLWATFLKLAIETHALVVEKLGYVISLARLSFYLLFMFSTVTCSVSVFTCTTAFDGVRCVIRGFSKILRGAFDDALTPEALSEAIAGYSRILSCVQRIEESLSLVVLCVYASATCTFFTVLSAALHGALHGDVHVVLTLGCSALIAVSTFLAVTLSGAGVCEAVRALRWSVVECCRIDASAGSGRPDAVRVQKELLLVLNLKEADLRFTAGGMFVVERSLILTVASVLITYGVILSQNLI